MSPSSTTVMIKLELDIGEGLRTTLIALGWTPPGETPPPPEVGLHDFVAQQPTTRHCLLFIGRGLVCNKDRDDPVHQVNLADWERDLLKRGG